MYLPWEGRFYAQFKSLMICVFLIHFPSGSTWSRLEGSEIRGQEVGKPISKIRNKAVRKRRWRKEDPGKDGGGQT